MPDPETPSQDAPPCNPGATDPPPRPMIKHMRLHVNLAGVLNTLKEEIQQAIEHVAFALRAAEAAQPGGLELPESFFQLTPARDKKRPWETVRLDFRSWVLGAALADCVEALGPVLDEAARVLAVYALGPRVRVDSDAEVRRLLDGPDERFRRGPPCRRSSTSSRSGTARACCRISRTLSGISTSCVAAWSTVEAW